MTHNTIPRSIADHHRAVVKVGLILMACICAQAGLANPAQEAMCIDITSFSFAPKEVTVAPGTKIVWTNRDETPHTATSRDKVFDSKALDTGDKFEYTLEREGEFAYYCAVHPYMTGIVHVRQRR